MWELPGWGKKNINEAIESCGPESKKAPKKEWDVWKEHSQSEKAPNSQNMNNLNKTNNNRIIITRIG